MTAAPQALDPFRSPPMLRAQSLRFDYPGLRALDDVGFTIEAGTITALVGPNGAGKSTLMRCLSGLERPHAGLVELTLPDSGDGDPVVVRVHDHPPRVHRQIGYLPDTFGMADSLTVAQMMRWRAATLRLKGAERDRRIRETLARVELADRVDQALGTLSRGQRQRVAIATTILHGPRLLILDEPASGLDPEARDSLSAVLRRMRDDGITLFISSHILSELEDYSTHLMILRGGRLIDHRPIDQTQELLATGRQAVILTLARADTRLEALLRAADPDAGIEIVDDRTARLLISADPDAHAAMLRHLVTAGLPISGFAAEGGRNRLKEAYLARLFGRVEATASAAADPADPSSTDAAA